MFQVEWAENASQQRVDILEFWIEHNHSETYSKRIFSESLVVEKLLEENPLLGSRTDIEEVRRILILRNFSMFYKIENQIVRILAFYDNRQNPDEFIM